MNHELTLNSRHLHNLLEASYAGTDEARAIGKENGYLLDEEFSNRKQRVFVDKHDNAIIAFTGSRTYGDILTDSALAVGLADLTTRFSDSTKLVEKVKKKYSHSPILAIGHSLGGSLAEHVNKTGLIDKVITVQKGVGLFGIGKKLQSNQTDIHSNTDYVSALSNTQYGGTHINNPKSFIIDPLHAHSYKNLRKFDRNTRF